MSKDTFLNVIYDYSRSACKKNHLDYRDVAHMVFIKIWSTYLEGKIKYIKSYIYTSIKNTIYMTMKKENKLMPLFEDYLGTEHPKHDFWINYNDLCRDLTFKERYIINKMIDGYTTNEIGNKLGLARSSVSVILHRIKMKNKD